MGKDKGMKLPKEKKKKKDKKNLIMISPKFEDIEGSDPNVFTENVKKSTLNKLYECPKKKPHVVEESSLSPSPTKKSKKEKELLETHKAKKKSKKNREPSPLSSRMNPIVNSPMKKSKQNLISAPPEQNQHSDLSDNDEIRHEKDNAGNGVVTSNKHIEEETGWAKEDFVTLLENMDKFIPEKDNLKYSSRIERLDWMQIKFNDHTANECKEKWKLVEKKIRGFRVLKEMVDDAKLWLDKPWSSFYNSNKKNRHPDLPRRPLTSYMLFYMAKKSKFAKKNPNLGLTELSKIVAHKFHKLSESKKQKYVDQARLLRKEYNEKMKKFIDTHPNESMSIRKKHKDDKAQMPGPQKPLPPIKLFIEEKLKHVDEDNTSKAEIITRIKETWKHLSTKKKVPWIRWAHENEKKYLEELEIYKSENSNFVMPKIKPLLSKEEVTILERMEGKPEKPPNSAYSLFSRLMLKDDQIKLTSIAPKERMKEISRLWAAVNDEEKKQYQEKAKHLLEIYKLEYATYLESLSEDKRTEELAKSQTRKRKKKDTEGEVKGKKLKQSKIEDLFNKKNEIKSVKDKSSSEDEEEEDKPNDVESDEDEHASEEEEDILNQPKKVREIKGNLDRLEPPKPSVNAFELFKEIYLTNPGNKESKALLIWDSMPKKEKERYQKKLEAQKQNYILKYKEFLAKLKPHEIKVYSMLKNQSSTQLSDSTEGEESDDEGSPDSSDTEQLQARHITTHKTEDSSSSKGSD